MRINGNAWLRMLTCAVWFVGRAKSGPLLCAQAAPGDKAEEGCKPCQLIERLIPTGKPSNKADTPDVAPSSVKAIEGLSQTELEGALRNAKACVKAAQAHTEEPAKNKLDAVNDRPEAAKDKLETAKDKPYCNVQLGSVGALINQIETVRDKIKLAQGKQGKLSAALKYLDGLPAMPGSRHDFPPKEVCPQCDGLWNDINAVKAFATSGKSLVTNVNTGKDVTKAEDFYNQAYRKLCPLRLEILNSSATATGLTYYTWTPTWAAYERLKGTLKSLILQEFCQQ